MAQQAQGKTGELSDGDQGFTGFNSRDNPTVLSPGTLSLSQNFRLNRGIATARKGLKKLLNVNTSTYGIRHVAAFRKSDGTDIIVLICRLGLYVFTPNTGAITGPVLYNSYGTIEDTDKVDAFQALGKLIILRGFNKKPLIWDGNSTITDAGTTSKFMPNSEQGIYVNNRAIVQSSSDELSVSHYLNIDKFELMDVFKINDGSNDSITAIAPWVLNEWVVFMRNRIYYASVGAGAYNAGDLPVAGDSYVKVLATDMGCVAKRSITQAGGGMMFLSDSGVYAFTPQQATTPEGMRAGVIGEPLSAPIEDIIYRINQNHVSKACSAYYNNRYYLAVPLDGSTVNNVVLVFNFVNKQWESIDTFPPGIDIQSMFTANYDGKKRLFFTDKDYGIYLAEELQEGDNFNHSTINNVLPVILRFFLRDEIRWSIYPIDSKIHTRSYNFGMSEDKRYSQVELDMRLPLATYTKTSYIAQNPDIEVQIDEFGAPDNYASVRDLPIRKIASSCIIKVQSFNGEANIRSLAITAMRTGTNIRSS